MHVKIDFHTIYFEYDFKVYLKHLEDSSTVENGSFDDSQSSK